MCTWKRKTKDPLLERFFEKYSLHFLRPPRQSLNVGSIVVRIPEGQTLTCSSLDGFFDPEMPELKINYNEIMGDCRGVFSDNMETEAGISVLDELWGALGIVGLGTRISALAGKDKGLKFRFSFDNPVRDSIDLNYLGGKLVLRKINIENPYYNEKSMYYIVSAVVRSSSINVTTDVAETDKVEFSAEFEKLAKSETKIKSEKLSEDTWRFAGETPITFGVELVELNISEDNRVKVGPVGEYVKVRVDPGDKRDIVPSIIDSVDGSPFLTLKNI